MIHLTNSLIVYLVYEIHLSILYLLVVMLVHYCLLSQRLHLKAKII